MRHTPRRSDDADVIRARLRALLDEGFRGGWVPGEDDVRPAADDDALPESDPVGRSDGHPADGTVDAPTGRHRAPGPAVRWDPGRPGARSLWVAGLLAALLLVGWTWADRPRVEPAPAPAQAPAPASGSAAPPAPTSSPEVGEAAGTATPLVVAVVGLVARPGLVTVPTGSRVADAVEAAGGLLPGTDPAAVNLAALVTDGQQIAVGVPGVPGSSQASPDAGGAGGGGLVDLNSATVQELDALPGIGPVLAERIVAHRDEQGPFRSVDQLDDVPGIGPTIFAELAELVTV